MKAIAIAAVLSALSLGATAARAGDDKLRLFLNGGFNPGSLDFSETRKFTEFTEPGTIAVDYKNDPGPGLEVGLQFNYFKHVGLMASYSLANRDETASYDARLPHPLYLDKPRQVSGETANYKYKEGAGHLDLVASGASGSFRFCLFGGIGFFRVTSDLIDRIQYSHAYPFDTVSVTAVPALSKDASATGYNLGAGLDYKLSRRIGAGAQVRYSRAKAKLVPSEGNTVELDAGGLQVSAGVRLFF